MSKIISFEKKLSDFEFEDYLNEDLALLKVFIVDDRPNKHNLGLSFDSIKEASPTLKGKAIVAKYNSFINDAEGHEENESPIGYFPNQDFMFTDDEDGYHSMYGYAVLFKSYCPEVYNLFVDKVNTNNNAIKNVSMEIRVLENSIKYENDVEQEIIDKFSFKGVTILGDKHNPAIPMAHAQMIEFSEKIKEIDSKYFSINSIKIDNSKENAINTKGKWSNPGRSLYGKLLKASNKESLIKEAYLIVGSDYENAPSTELKYPHHSISNGKLVLNIQGLQASFSRASQQNIVSGEVKSHLLRHYKELNLDTSNFMGKEDNMDDDKKNNKEDIENKNNLPQNDDKNKEDVKDNNKNDDKNKEDVKDNNKNDDNNKEVDYEAKCSEYACKLAEMEAKEKAYMEELEELRKYKAEKENAEKNFKVSELFSEIMDILPNEELEKFKEESKDITNENFEAFSNKVKAHCLSFAVPKTKDKNRISIVNELGKKENKWW